ncbi:hypothetical protein [Aestuariimicrobium sp. T2.26MG-19.2B]|uniref:hypothetical protein n=1 Tax=Aestuariimicrobium sp. T2.26MG-19.2B TaxID=3040679 RepID=UPI00247758A6|nr:hypothetical protein [Aestuariimicrobium sp. T2.26MG-19.2B]CAI9400445.1 hypothetical protein AESSP_00389 [Aestuariimicrobium sp. T2.26MG-19.2B]
MARKTETTETAAPTTCVNGHPRDAFWTVTASGRKYCRACAAAASRASKAKNLTPNPKRLTPEVLGFLEELFTASKRGSEETREQVAAWIAAQKG